MTADLSPEALLARLDAELSPGEREALRIVESYCAERGVGLYLVGGAVRDLLLGRATVDLDLAVEGETASIAGALATATGGRATVHERFGTASVRGAGFHLDLAQTRRETYTRPGSLPTVEPVASILNDLARRDFTVNALALRLTPPVALIDPFGGEADLRAGLVRVLHEQSFQDDATRMLRAARYAARLGFALETVTRIWLERDLSYVDNLSGPRLRRELTLLFEEASAPQGALQASRLGVLSAVHPLLHLNEPSADRWREALLGRHFAPVEELGYCLVAARAEDEADVASLTTRLHLTKGVERALFDLVRLRRASDKLASAAADPVAAVDLLDGIAKGAVWAMSLLDAGEAGRCCAVYLERWQTIRPALKGNDLIAMGVPSGEGLGALLRRLREARLRGEAESRTDEERIVREVLGERRMGR